MYRVSDVLNCLLNRQNFGIKDICPTSFKVELEFKSSFPFVRANTNYDDYIAIVRMGSEQSS